jgi:hypothetical protein
MPRRPAHGPEPAFVPDPRQRMQEINRYLFGGAIEIYALSDPKIKSNLYI